MCSLGLEAHSGYPQGQADRTVAANRGALAREAHADEQAERALDLGGLALRYRSGRIIGPTPARAISD